MKLFGYLGCAAGADGGVGRDRLRSERPLRRRGKGQTHSFLQFWGIKPIASSFCFRNRNFSRRAPQVTSDRRATPEAADLLSREPRRASSRGIPGITR